MKRAQFLLIKPLAVLTTVLICVGAALAGDPKETVLYNFKGRRDGAGPVGVLIAGQAGNLYGTTEGDPSGDSCCLVGGAVFQLKPPATKGGAWTEVTLYDFFTSHKPGDGAAPTAGVVADAKGNLYGTTWVGGQNTCGTGGCGIAYQVKPPVRKGGRWTEVVLYDFKGGSDGAWPLAGLVADSAGNLYGVTNVGGDAQICPNGANPPGCGTVFQLSPPAQKGGAWTEKVIYRFNNGPNGLFPLYGTLVIDKTGALYGTAAGGSFSKPCLTDGCGVAFKLTPPAKKGGHWTEHVIYRFKGGSDGMNPQMSLTFDAAGNLYGSTALGGSSDDGTVFELSPLQSKGGAWKETVLYSFTGNLLYGAGPSGVILDQVGSLYGTTLYGTDSTCILGCGMVFKLTPAAKKGGPWTETTLHAFDGTDGANPFAGVILGNGGVLFGTTTGGGTGTACNSGPCGTVFEITP